MADDTTGRSADHHRGGAHCGRPLQDGGGSGGGHGAGSTGGCGGSMVMVVLRAETGRRGGLTAVFGLQHPQLGFGTLQFDGFLLELE